LRWINVVLGSSPRAEDMRGILAWASGAAIVPVYSGANSGFHNLYASAIGITANAPLSMKLPSGVEFGIDLHPWISVNGHTEASELNFEELYAITSESDDSLNGPFLPDSLRLMPETVHKEAFARFMDKLGESPSNYELVYVRYFISARRTIGGLIPSPRIAFAFRSQLDQPMKVKLGGVG
jgi:hypothetical protein